MAKAINPYGDGTASVQIVNAIRYLISSVTIFPTLIIWLYKQVFPFVQLSSMYQLICLTIQPPHMGL